MKRPLLIALAVLLVGVSWLQAQERIRPGKVKKVDPAGGTITITAEGKDLEFKVTDATRIFGPGNDNSAKRLEDDGLKPGSDIVFKATDGDATVLEGIRIGGRPRGEGGGGEQIRRAKIKTLDVDQKQITLTIEDQDQEFTLLDDTRVLGSQASSLKERLAGFKVGEFTFFVSAKRDGKDAIVALKLDDGRSGQGGSPPPQVDTSKFKPLDELGAGEHQGRQGGFYPGGKNERPVSHEAAGLALAKQIQPLDADGKPDASGKIVLLSVGMSNTAQSSQGFQRALLEVGGTNPRFQFVNGAQGGMTAAAIQDPNDDRTGTRYWTTLDQMLKSAGVTREQVQAVWIKQADAGPNQGFPAYAEKLQGELATIVQLLPQRFPNVKLCYLSSRTYGGYATTMLNPEPYAYESGFAVKWLIEQQLKGEPELNYDPKQGPVKAPWLSWGPYLWANGKTPRADGFFYEREDFVGDGTHQSPSGQRKVGELMLKFFQTDSTTKSWFLKQ